VVLGIATADYSADEFVWQKGEPERLCFVAESKGASVVRAIAADNRSAAFPMYVSGHTNGSLSISPDGPQLAFVQSGLDRAAEVFVEALDEEKPRKPLNVSRANGALLAELDLPRPESVTVKGAGDTPMHMWILKPPGFDEKKKWPLVYLVHGG